jgi:hypothetical protein
MKEHSTKLLHSYCLTIPSCLCERQGFITSISMKAQLVVLFLKHCYISPQLDSTMTPGELSESLSNLYYLNN